jgi:hypothetical protein
LANRIAIEAESKESKLPKKENRVKAEILLVEFKAPKELVEAFDIKWKPQFSNRSEAIRTLMRSFLEAANEEN